MTADKELGAMERIAAVLDEFEDGDSEARARVIQWVAARYGGPWPERTPQAQNPISSEAQKPEAEQTFDDLADLFVAAEPRTDQERALVVSYWLTESKGKGEFRSREVNSELKNLGYRVTNITSVFTRLMKRKPSLAMQTAKTGASRQARKRYKITRAGHDAVERMVRGEGTSDD